MVLFYYPENGVACLIAAASICNTGIYVAVLTDCKGAQSGHTHYPYRPKVEFRSSYPLPAPLTPFSLSYGSTNFFGDNENTCGSQAERSRCANRKNT